MAQYRANASPAYAAAFFRKACTPRPRAIESMSRLYAEAPETFSALLKRSWATGDQLAFLPASQVLERNGGLSPKSAHRFWIRLLDAQSWTHALALMEDPRFALPGSADYWCDLARARAAGRTLESARGAVSAALDLEAGYRPAAELEARLARAAELAGRVRAFSGWAEFAGLIDVLIGLGRYAHAAQVLKLYAPNVEKRADARDALSRAWTLFGVIEPEWAFDLLLGLEPLFRKLKLSPAFAWACEALSAAPGAPAPSMPERSDFPLGEACLAQALAASGRWQAACAAFGPLASHPENPLDCRLELAQCVGRLAAAAFPPELRAAGGRRRIIDVFPIFDELMLLGLKLEEMSPWVDQFVIVEARTTFSGRPKPLVFEQNKAAFSRYADKIIHQAVEFPAWADTPWAREFYQRDAALKSLSGLCAPDDLVLVTDVDEILRREAIEGFDGPHAALGMDVFRYFFNLRQAHERQRTYSAVMKARYLGCIGLAASRIGLSKYDKSSTLWDAGWHFSSVMGADDLMTKANSYSHVENASSDRGQFHGILERIRAEKGLQGFERMEVDARFPDVLRNNWARVSPFVL